MRIAVIGAGKMGGTILKALSKHEEYKLLCAEKEKERREWVERFCEAVHTHASELDAEVYILCVKPAQTLDVLSSLKEKGALFISCAAAVSLKSMQEVHPEAPLIRCMPNIFCAVGKGATFFCMGEHAKEEDKEKMEEIFGKLGYTYLIDEELMPAITAFAGCGPAYILLFAEAMMDAGVLVGLSPKLCLQIVEQLFVGGANLLKETEEHPAKLRQLVATPGGVTAAALHQLSKSGFSAAIQDAIKSATERVKELSI
jgi:pyrroline-5-carboxylate reductase